MYARTTSNNAVWCLVACISIILLPFIIFDYHFANDQSCAQLPLHKSSIAFPLSTWLKVDGFLTVLQLVGLVIIIVTVASETKDNPNPFFYLLFLMMCLISLFNFIWLIIGAVMFWGELNPSGHCSSSISSYMWARLIIGFLSIAMNLLSARRG
jgi:hypothetical protein